MRLSSAHPGHHLFHLGEELLPPGLLLHNTALPVTEAQLAFLPSHSLNCKSFLSYTTLAHSMWSLTVFQRYVAHTNGIESFWSMLKRGYVGVFHQLSVKHLNRYGAEFAGRHDIRLLDALDMMLNVVVDIVGKRLPYKALVASIWVWLL